MLNTGPPITVRVQDILLPLVLGVPYFALLWFFGRDRNAPRKCAGCETINWSGGEFCSACELENTAV